MLARQVLNHLSHGTSSFLFLFFISYFGDGVLLFCPWPALVCNHPIESSCVAMIIDIYHHTWFIC
jgi:hypothetical protein